MILECVTGNPNLDDLQDSIIDTEFCKLVYNKRNNDYGIDAVYLDEENHTIKLFNYKSDNLLETLKQCRGNFIVIDNADILLNDEIRRFINFEFSNQYMLFSRNCDGLNVSDKSFKILKVEGNRITLEEEL